jgi:hypothetical protein
MAPPIGTNKGSQGQNKNKTKTQKPSKSKGPKETSAINQAPNPALEKKRKAAVLPTLFEGYKARFGLTSGSPYLVLKKNDCELHIRANNFTAPGRKIAEMVKQESSAFHTNGVADTATEADYQNLCADQLATPGLSNSQAKSIKKFGSNEKLEDRSRLVSRLSHL